MLGESLADRKKEYRERDGGGRALLVACLSHLTIDHASLSRRSTGAWIRCVCSSR